MWVWTFWVLSMLVPSSRGFKHMHSHTEANGIAPILKIKFVLLCFFGLGPESLVPARNDLYFHWVSPCLSCFCCVWHVVSSVKSATVWLQMCWFCKAWRATHTDFMSKLGPWDQSNLHWHKFSYFVNFAGANVVAVFVNNNFLYVCHLCTIIVLFPSIFYKG